MSFAWEFNKNETEVHDFNYVLSVFILMQLVVGNVSFDANEASFLCENSLQHSVFVYVGRI